MKVNSIIGVIFLILTVSCKTESKSSIDFNLLKKDWINAQYHYPLFFNDFTIFSHPWEMNGQCIYQYKIKDDTLQINRVDTGFSFENWEKLKILFLNKDVLILKNISKKDVYIEGDTLTLASTATFNENEVKIKRIEFQAEPGRIRKSFIIRNDSLMYTGDGNPNDLKNKVFILKSKIRDQLNLKMKLIDSGCRYNMDQRFTDDKPLLIKIYLEDNHGEERTIIIDGYLPDNFRLLLFVMYLYNLDEIIKYNPD